MALRYVLPALAAVGLASAACSSSDPIVIQNQGDATSELSGCTTYTGSVTIRNSYTGTLELGSLRSITGDLTVKSAPNITGINAGSLENIGGTFTLNDDQTLATLSFTKLTTVGSIDFSGLPNLNTLNWGGPLKKADNLNIQNTFLQSLDGINLQQVKGINIANNKLLQTLSFQVTSIDGNVIITNNGDRLVAQFPNLETVRNLTFRNVPSITINSLKNVSGSLGFYDNSFDSLSCVNLTLVGGTLAINGNKNLNNVSMPVLKEIRGGFQVQNNTVLEEVTFPALQSVFGAIDFYGPFTSVKFPALKDVRGGFNLQSSKNIKADCDVFAKQAGSNNVIKGKYQCISEATTPGNSTTSGGGSSKKNAGITSSPSATLVTLGLLAAGVLAVL